MFPLKIHRLVFHGEEKKLKKKKNKFGGKDSANNPFSACVGVLGQCIHKVKTDILVVNFLKLLSNMKKNSSNFSQITKICQSNIKKNLTSGIVIPHIST